MALLLHVTLALVTIALSDGEIVMSPSANQLTNWGVSIATDTNGIHYPSLTASQAVKRRGQILLQDMFLLEKTQSFNRERIPDRVVHAKGVGAFGVFQATHDISEYTKAEFLRMGTKTRVAVRFSTVGGEAGSADTNIDPKGFAVKFYTTQGIHDLVGNNIQVFPIRDPMLFADINRSRKRNPETHLRDATSWWDFTALRPETTLHTLHLFSDMGTPKSLRGMDGAGVHTYKMVNAGGDAVYVKFHWKTKQKKEFFTPDESALMAGTNPDVLLMDMYDAIATKNYPSWDLFIQVMTFAQAEKHNQNPFDITTFWRPEDYPLIPVGTMTLNENHKDYFSQIEQLAFSPSRMVPGIEPSPDRMLAGRIFSYPDAQMYRLGVNFNQIPVNRCPFEFNTYHRDGVMQTGENGEGALNYFPNSFRGLVVGQNVQHSKFKLESGDVDRFDSGEEDNFSMAKIYLEKDVTRDEWRRIARNIAQFLVKADREVQEKWVVNIAHNITTDFALEVRAALVARRVGFV